MRVRSLINKLRGVTDVPSLMKKGLSVGENVFTNFGCIIDESFCWLISIGNNVTLAPNVHILAHDASTKKALGYTKMGGKNW
jgi:maltose O-acetyltransferase